MVAALLHTGAILKRGEIIITIQYATRFAIRDLCVIIIFILRLRKEILSATTRVPFVILANLVHILHVMHAAL